MLHSLKKPLNISITNFSSESNKLPLDFIIFKILVTSFFIESTISLCIRQSKHAYTISCFLSCQPLLKDENQLLQMTLNSNKFLIFLQKFFILRYCPKHLYTFLSSHGGIIVLICKMTFLN